MTTILYVDDEPVVRRAVATLLPRYGFAVHTASNSKAARRCFAKYPIDGAFIDIWLGDENGFELYAWIQQHHAPVAAHVTFITGEVDPDAPPETTLSALGRPVLLKPFTIEDLARHARTWDSTRSADRHGSEGESFPGPP
jgi:DNA-binding response OmpR family regulator